MKSLHPGLIAVLAVLLMLPGLAYLGLRLALPGDASRPVMDFLSIVPGGLAVQPAAARAEGLQRGDIVTAVQGRGVDEIVQGVFSGQDSGRPPERIEYQVQRGGQTLAVSTERTRFSFAETIRGNWSILASLVYLQLVSLVVFRMRPRLAAAQQFLLVASVSFSSSLIYFLGLQVDDLLQRWVVLLFLTGAVAFYGLLLAGLFHLGLVFPKPHPLLNRYPRLLPLVYGGVWVPMLLYLAVRWPGFDSAARLALAVQGTGFMSILFLPLLLAFTWSNYRTGNEREKRQVRWILWSMLISLVPYLIFSVIPPLFGVESRLATSAVGILWSSIPTAFAIAVLHERLFDIDVIIRRTLIYSALTFTIGAVFFASVLGLQGFFRVVTGENQPPLATVLSTLMITAIFNPVRRRIQRDIDRRFYRRKYNAERILREFALKTRNEVEVETISKDLLKVVEETMEPRNLTLWIW